MTKRECFIQGYQHAKREVPWVESIGKHGKYDKYFRYFRQSFQDGTTYYERHARPGYEHLEHDHRPIEQIEQCLPSQT